MRTRPKQIGGRGVGGEGMACPAERIRESKKIGKGSQGASQKIGRGVQARDDGSAPPRRGFYLAKTGVHPLGWTDGEGENRLTEPGFRGESPWPSTARIRSSSSARSSKNFWVGSHCTPSRGATGSAAI